MAETKPTILVADDPMLHRLYRLALSRSGFEVLTESSFEKAKAILESGHNIGALVTACGLSPPTGLDLIEVARQKRPELPCLLVSAVCSPATPEFIKIAKRYGNIDYVQKCEGWFDYLGPTLQKYFK